MRKSLLLMGASAIALTVGTATQAWADEPIADASVGAEDETVSGNYAADYGSTRLNTINNGAYNGAAGITHAQQNNGSNNSIGAATAAHANIANNQNIGGGAAVYSNTFDNETVNVGGTRDNEILNSFEDYFGVATVQQNNGDHNEIGAATAVHTGTGGRGNASQSVSAEGNTSAQRGDDSRFLVDEESARSNLINPSFNNAGGVATVQQNNGNGNAMSAATAVFMNMGAGRVGQSVSAGGSVGNQAIVDRSQSRDNTIDSSFDGYSGVATVQQNNGDGNVLSAATGVVGNLGNANLPAPSTVDQDADTSAGNRGLLRGLDVRQEAWGDRDNAVTNSFNGAAGIATVQQNNGSNNVMAGATAVNANIDTTGIIDGDFERVRTQSASNYGSIEGTTMSTEMSAAGDDLDRSNLINPSFNGYEGIATVQQNNGDNNMMGAATAVVANVGSHENTDVVNWSTASNEGMVSGVETRDWASNRGNTVTNSFGNAAGVLTVQQNNGSQNVIQAANAVVANLGSADHTANRASNAAYGNAEVTENWAIATEFVDRTNSVSGGAFNGAAGIMTLQQNNGDNNVMGSANAVIVDDSGGGGLGFGPASSMAALGATVSGNTSIVEPTVGAPGFLNTVSGSFMGAAGVMVVQQNNGNNNAIQSAISVVANY